jgi:hypothetical protein
LIEDGTSFVTDGFPDDDELVDELVLDDELLLLLLPHAAIAPTQRSETGTASHLFENSITSSFPEDGRRI